MSNIIYDEDRQVVVIDQKEYSKEYFEDLYITQNFTYKQMRATLGRGIPVIQRILKFFNIKKDPKLVSSNRQKNLIQKYGVANVSQIESVKKKKEQSAIEKYGVRNVSQATEVQLKKEKTFREHYGKDFYFQTDEFKDVNKEYWLEHYGVENVGQAKEIQEKVTKTVMEKYGVAWSCMREEARRAGSNDSKPNLDFAKLLEDNNIDYQREFCIDRKGFDFKVGNILIEIDPTATHNTKWSPFTEDHVSRTHSGYHKEKSKIAQNAGYRCIHIWDWDNKLGIISLLKARETVFARKCEIKEVSKEETAQFVNENHIQGYAESKINIGLYYKDELVSIMTFGKPRYNHKYQYELIRYCSKYNVIGGAEKIFKHFITKFSPDSVVSYCDLSKFSGETYVKLGFTKIRNSSPSLHWYNMKTKAHYNDSLIRSKGFSRIIHHCEPSEDTVSGKNYDLMIAEGFLPVYDCGQATYVWDKEQDLN